MNQKLNQEKGRHGGVEPPCRTKRNRNQNQNQKMNQKTRHDEESPCRKTNQKKW
jgi:hypothetical protein